MHIFYDVFDDETIDKYKNLIAEYYEYKCSLGGNPGSFTQTRIHRIPDHQIIKDIQKHIESQLRVKLSLAGAELQVWPVGGHSERHVHDARGQESTDYNTLLYLNDDFTGGHFYTDDVTIKPRKGMLTFFNGQTTYHGVTPVEGTHRYTIICWWKNTEFINESLADMGKITGAESQ